MKYNFLIIAVCLIFISFFIGLQNKSDHLKSPLVNKKFPEINLTSFNKKKLTDNDFKNEIILVNFFASWCIPCIVEHDSLFEIKKKKTIKIYGINYKDNNKNLGKWLNKLGNPYNKIGIDSSGLTAIDWGVNGIPESFLIDKNGIIKHKISGVITKKEIEKLIMKIELLEK